MNAWAWRLGSLIVLAALVLLWGEVAAWKLVSPVFLPTPLRAWGALVHGFHQSDLLEKLMGTIRHMLAGWVVASLLGVAIGAIVGSSRAARDYIAPTLEFLRPLPASAVIPVAIAMFGLTPQMAIGVIAFGSIWPALLAAVHGFGAVEPRLLEVQRALGLSRLAGNLQDLSALRGAGHPGGSSAWSDGLPDPCRRVRDDRWRRWARPMGPARGAGLSIGRCLRRRHLARGSGPYRQCDTVACGSLSLALAANMTATRAWSRSTGALLR